MRDRRTVWVEGFVLEHTPTGVGRYLGNVLQVWAARNWWPNAQKILLIHRGLTEPWTHLTAAYPVMRLAFPRASFLLWQQLRVRAWLRRQPPGIYLAPNYTVPLAVPHCRLVILHDLAMWHHPEWFPRRKRRILQWAIRRSVEEAARILVPSATVAEEVTTALRIPSDRIVITYEGWDPRLIRPPRWSRETLCTRFGLPEDRPMWLTVGAIFQRRQPELVLDAWVHMARQRTDPPTLVWIGANRTTPRIDVRRIIRTRGLESTVHFLGYQPEPVVHAFYHACDGVLYLSAYEGFGLPVLEALVLGKPVIVSDIPVFREIYGNAVYRIPLDVAALVDALRAGISPPPTHVVHSLRTRFTWERTARTIADTIYSLAEP